ncbi:MAG: preprotein translocase subunit SecE [Lachnospiraceae bacterium]|nr:preprotein translocase subunit SecE [Lachnospiraceae bacterium]
MSENKETSPTLKRSWFQNLKLEFKKITWPTKQRLVREVLVVLISAVLLGAMIALIDWLLKLGLQFIW